MFSKKQILNSLAVIVISVLIIGGIAYAQVINNYYFGSDKTVNTEENDDSLGSVSAIGGICDGSEPTTQFCNVNAYELETQSGLTVTGDTVVDKFVQGGSVYSGTTTPSASFTFTADDFCDNSYIGITPSAVINATLPATTTLFADCLTSDGDFIDVVFGNNSPTAATTTTIVAGAGIDLQEPDGQNVVIGGLNYAQIKIMRISSSEAVAIIDETIPAD